MDTVFQDFSNTTFGNEWRVAVALGQMSYCNLVVNHRIGLMSSGAMRQRARTLVVSAGRLPCGLLASWLACLLSLVPTKKPTSEDVGFIRAGFLF